MIGALIVPSQNAEFPGTDGANYAFGFLVLLQVREVAMLQKMDPWLRESLEYDRYGFFGISADTDILPI